MYQTVYEVFRNRALSRPDQPAVLAPGKTTATYSELLQFVDVMQKSLHRGGLTRTSRVGILLPERVRTAAAHLAIVSTCVSAPLNPDMTPEELVTTVNDLHLNALLIDDSTPDRLRRRAESLGVQILIADDRSNIAGIFKITTELDPGDVDTAPPTFEDIAVLMQTSGTTSKQKTVPRRHSNQVAQLIGFSKALGMTPSDRCMNLMPVYHTTGIGSEFLAPILTGASVVFIDLNPATLESMVERYRPTWFNLVPSMHRDVLARLEGRTGVFKNSSLRFTRSSSAKMPLTLRAQIEKIYGLPLVESYGSTETGSITFAGVSPGDYKAGSVGRPAHDGVQILDAEGDVVAANARGEVCVIGPTVMTGYEDNPIANADAFRNGFYRTGDEAYIDGDGFLFITGRLRETVNRGGEKISLAEIDDAILKVEGVAQGASFSVPHPRLGQEVYAAVVPVVGRQLLAGEVRVDLASRLSWAKVPKRVFVVTELPTNSIGKIVRTDLANLVEP